MGQLTASKIFNAIYGLFSGLDASDRTLLGKTLWQDKVTLQIHDNATAGTAFTTSFVWENDTGVDVRVTLAEAVAPIAVAANATNFATFTLTKLDSAGLNGATVATFATDTVTTDDMVANVPRTMTLNDANVIVPSGSILVGAVSKTAAGVALTAATSRAAMIVTLEPV